MRLSIIAAMAENQVIGRNNQLPWKLPADLRRFRSLTMGHHLLMGRKTFASIGRPLPGRTIVVMTRQQNYSPANVLVAHALEEAVEMTRCDEEVFVAGGAQIYQQTLNRADRLYLTIIHEEFDGDTYFPEYSESDWELICREDRNPDEGNRHPHSFLVFKRKG